MSEAKIVLRGKSVALNIILKGGEGLKPNELVSNLRKGLTQRKKKKGNKKCPNPGKIEKRYNWEN